MVNFNYTAPYNLNYSYSTSQINYKAIALIKITVLQNYIKVPLLQFISWVQLYWTLFFEKKITCTIITHLKQGLLLPRWSPSQLSITITRPEKVQLQLHCSKNYYNCNCDWLHVTRLQLNPALCQGVPVCVSILSSLAPCIGILKCVCVLLNILVTTP